MNIEYLIGSENIRQRIMDIFSDDGRKVVAVGFVGSTPLDFLPLGISNLKVICWPKVGSTMANGIRDLLSKDIEVKFCDNLHSKIYWSENNGVIISSSNLSASGLSENGLIEVGVHIHGQEFDVAKFEGQLNLRQVTHEEILDLEKGNEIFFRRNKKYEAKVKVRNFAQWYEEVLRPKWKIIYFTESSKKDKETKQEILSTYGTATWVNDNDIEFFSQFSTGDYLYQFKVDEDTHLMNRQNGRWLFVDHITKTKKVIQIDKLDTKKASAPFEIDSKFKLAFKNVFNSSPTWNDVCSEDYELQDSFLENLYREYIGK